MKKKIQIALGLGLVLALSAGIGVATGAIPTSNGTISACTAKVAGVRTLRLVDQQAGESCKGAEKLISWNQKGDPGAPGARGPAGPAGPKGSSGSGAAKFTSRLSNDDAGPGTSQIDSHCNPGEHVTGGGYIVDSPAVHVTVSAASNELDKWSVEVVNDSGSTQIVLVQAICAS